MLAAWEDIVQCAYNTTDFPRPSIFGLTSSRDYMSNNIELSSTACFDRHATDEVKESLALIGDYHMFLIDRTFRNQKDQVINWQLLYRDGEVTFEQ